MKWHEETSINFYNLVHRAFQKQFFTLKLNYTQSKMVPLSLLEYKLNPAKSLKTLFHRSAVKIVALKSVPL